MSLPPVPANTPSVQAFSVPHPDGLAVAQQHAQAHTRVAEMLSAASPLLPKQDHEVWLDVFLARTHGTRLAETNSAYADQAVKLYRMRFPQVQAVL